MFKMLILRQISWFFGLFNAFLRIYAIHNAHRLLVRMLPTFSPYGALIFNSRPKTISKWRH